MPSALEYHHTALREAFTAHLYGFDATFRSGDPFDAQLAEIGDWALRADGYDRVSLDVFTGSGHRTLAGEAPPEASLDLVHEIVTAHPRSRFHALSRVPAGARPVGDVEVPVSWAGATLWSSTGVVLGCLDLWAPVEVAHRAETHALLPILARAAMHVLEERRRVVAGRAGSAAGPRPVVPR